MRASTSVEATPAAYDVVHTTRYTYSESVSVSHHLARLTPRPLPHQELVQQRLLIDPVPAMTRTHLDYFGNAATLFVMDGAHRSLDVRAESRLIVKPRRLPDAGDTPPWDQARDHDLLPLEAIDCIFDPNGRAMADQCLAYAVPSFPRQRPLLEAVLDLTRRIHEDFSFDPEATTVATPLDQVFRLRRGVCQDFARLAIACLRTLQIPARYVSGYLETDPPPGAPKLSGADASHAWLAVYCPGHEWIDVDPTNNLLPSTRHITLAWGRDYGDVSPIAGVILGGGSHSLAVSVDVVRITGA